MQLKWLKQSKETNGSNQNEPEIQNKLLITLCSESVFISN